MNWTKSSFCRFDSPQCVEVSELDQDMIHVRDSKNKDNSTLMRLATLRFYREEWQAFIDGVKAGEFDLKSDNTADAEEQMEQV